MSKWVQHISGQGEKWQVWEKKERPGWMKEGCEPNYDIEWCVCSHGSNVPSHLLPKSEYRLCDPPEEWEDVTGECDWCGGLAFSHRKAGRFGDEIVTQEKGYRFTKIDGMHNGPAFIIERKNG